MSIGICPIIGSVKYTSIHFSDVELFLGAGWTLKATDLSGGGPTCRGGLSGGGLDAKQTTLAEQIFDLRLRASVSCTGFLVWYHSSHEIHEKHTKTRKIKNQLGGYADSTLPRPPTPNPLTRKPSVCSAEVGRFQRPTRQRNSRIGGQGRRNRIFLYFPEPCFFVATDGCDFTTLHLICLFLRTCCHHYQSKTEPPEIHGVVGVELII
ncbi:hypothetical protein SDC9_46618 [bioreactor metagenome]|uniref:Uncharacterized protein n=1 Tax=bioreactor metagenome TaxID=1076179 RepID=A0A644WDI2_9ZZZZ